MRFDFKNYNLKQLEVYYILLSLRFSIGHGVRRPKKTVHEEANQWMLNEEVMDAILLRVIWSGEEESMSFHQEDSEIVSA